MIRNRLGRVVEKKAYRAIQPIEGYDWVWDIPQKLTPHQKCLLLAIAENGGFAREPQRLVKALGISSLAADLVAKDLIHEALLHPAKGGGYCLDIAVDEQHEASAA